MGMSFTLRIKPLSINAAFCGRRFKTPAAKQYDNAVALLLPKGKVNGEYYKVEYDFYLRNFAMVDIDNLIKNLQDCIVRKGIISDDRRILDCRARKFRSVVDSIDVKIEATNVY